MKNLFSFIMVGLAFTVLQVSISQAQVSATGGGQAAVGEGKEEDEGGRVKVWNRQTHGAKQGRIVQGTKISVKEGEDDGAHAPGASTEAEAAPVEEKRDKDGIWKRQTHGAKQGRIVQGTKIP